MRLKIDVYFEGKEDLTYMMGGLKGICDLLIEKLEKTNDKKPVSLVIPLGVISICNGKNAYNYDSTNNADNVEN